MTDRLALPGSLSIGVGCFACGLANAHGLKIAYEKVHDAVEATFTLDERYQGAPAYLHGGIVMTVLDEAMAWATIALRARFALTTTFSSRFTRPVLVGQPHTVRATCGVLSADGRSLTATATLCRADGTVCATAEGSYRAMTVAETAHACGVEALPAQMLRLGFAAGDLG